MKNKKIILISIIGLLIIGFISLYNSLNFISYKIEYRGEIFRGQTAGKDNYFNKKLKGIVPQNIKDFLKDTIFVFKKVSLLEQQLAEKSKQLADERIENKELKKILSYLELEQFDIELEQIAKCSQKMGVTSCINLFFGTHTEFEFKKK